MGAPFTLRPFAVSILSQATYSGRHLALAVNLDDLQGKLIAQVWDPSQASQQWLPVFWFDPSNGLPSGSVALINVLSGYAARYVGNGLQVMQVPTSQIDGNSVWSFGGNEGGNYCAVRPLSMLSQNLNIQGDQSAWVPGAPVITWGWGSGDPHPNDIWTFATTSADYNGDLDPIVYSDLLCTVQAWTGLALDMVAAPYPDTAQILANTLSGATITQQFLPVAWFSNGYFLGFVLLNWAYDFPAVVLSNGYGQRIVPWNVDLGDIDGAGAWGAIYNQGDGFSRFYLVQHPDQNINIPGDGPYYTGSQVVTWEWGQSDPQPNDCWRCLRALS